MTTTDKRLATFDATIHVLERRAQQARQQLTLQQKARKSYLASLPTAS